MQRTDDMNILLNMSLKLKGFWLDMKIRETKDKATIVFTLIIDFLSFLSTC